jgi:alcohol dehydrogenase class IV
MKTDEYYFGLYESVKGESNLINPDPYASDKNKYILKNFNPKIIAPVIALVNPEAITDKTKMRDSILPAVLIREEERLQAESAALKLTQMVGMQSRKFEEKAKKLQDEIKKLNERIQQQKVLSMVL